MLEIVEEEIGQELIFYQPVTHPVGYNKQITNKKTKTINRYKIEVERMISLLSTSTSMTTTKNFHFSHNRKKLRFCGKNL